MPSPRVLLAGSALLLGALNLWVCLARSWIPFAVEGRVEDVVVRFEKHPGEDDVIHVHLSGAPPRQTDAEVAALLRVGDAVRKSAWTRTLQVGDRSVLLEPSRDFVGMCGVVLVALAVCGLLLGVSGPPGPRSRRGAGSPPRSPPPREGP